MNGVPWGLFLALEEPEESFARRNYGPGHGRLYKPDYHSLNAENADVALRVLASGEDLERAVDVDQVLRYFTVQVFVMNWDSYLGHTGHNYFLYEKDGVLAMLPWDYNLAFGTYALGMTDPIRDPNEINHGYLFVS